MDLDEDMVEDMAEDTVVEEGGALASGVVPHPGPISVWAEVGCLGAATSYAAPVRWHRGHISRHPSTQGCQLLLGMRPIRLK
jgi:hypothetical protein